LAATQSTAAIARLWAPPDPELTNQGLAAEPRYLLERLQDPAYAQRYQERLGEAVEPDVSDTPDARVNRPDEGALARLATIVQVVGSAAFAAAVARIIAADTAGVLQREPEYPPLPFWALQPAKALQTASART
jgi:hypothetical protein